MLISKYNRGDFSDAEKETLFRMYSQTYQEAGEELWFKTKEELFKRYPCLLTIDRNYQKCYVMFQFKQKFNKISLICHDGTRESKENLMNLLHKLLSTPGYILEASGAVSWILRSKKTPIIGDKERIEEALDLKPGDENDYITMNENFKEKEIISLVARLKKEISQSDTLVDESAAKIIIKSLKGEQSYTRTCTFDGKQHVSPETLFGKEGCDFPSSDTPSCSRECTTITPTRTAAVKGRDKKIKKKKTKKKKKGKK